ncbi:MAG: elongation factor Ts [Spirochaetales bacterium]|nr:elongation factor Ts [Spirochaetales bacterium]
MEIKAQDVKSLREKTGAGMMDCKKALVETQGNFAAAEKRLKEMGLAAAAKRDSKAANEGRVYSKVGGDKCVLLEIGSETDFVAKNDDFIKLGETLIDKVYNENITSATEAMTSMVDDIRAKIKENIQLKRFELIKLEANEIAKDYIHGEGRIGVIVKLKAEDASKKNDPKISELAFDLAMHIAAFAPLYLDEAAVDPTYLKEQEEIFNKQAENLGKPANVLKGIVQGKIKKHLAEICFVDQKFVKDDKLTVAQVVSNLGKELGTTLSISGYTYYKLGAE